MSLQSVTKITHKELMEGKLTRAEVTVGDEKKLLPIEQDTAIVRGVISGHETGETKFGEFVKFIGTFEAIRIQDGEKFFSKTLILPSNASDVLFDSYSSAKKEDPTAELSFVMVLGVKPDFNGAVGYKHTVKLSGAGMEKNDPLAAIRASTDAQLAEILGAEKFAALNSPKSTTAQLPDGTKADAETGEVKEEPKSKNKAA